jgi:hypothetical protein
MVIFENLTSLPSGSKTIQVNNSVHVRYHSKPFHGTAHLEVPQITEAYDPK